MAVFGAHGSGTLLNILVIDMRLHYANTNKTTRINIKNDVLYLTFPKLEEAGVIHGFSTRAGGVSTGHLASMNLSFNRGDDPANVLENFRRIGEAIGFCHEDLVLSDQKHHDRIRIVSSKDKGDGILRPAMSDIDGLVTDQPGIPLGTFYADCVPLMFYDPVKKVIAMAHSGWKGTVLRIGASMVSVMEEQYNCRAADIICAIGPSICKSCYEVSEDVIEKFQSVFDKDEMSEIVCEKENGKYLLDLWKANEEILLKAGILREHLDITDLCTCCNSHALFSHRGSHGKRGNMGGFMVL